MGNLEENERNIEEDESILASVNEFSTDDDSDDGYISRNALEEIWFRSQNNRKINARYAIFKISYHIRQTQTKCNDQKFQRRV